MEIVIQIKKGILAYLEALKYFAAFNLIKYLVILLILLLFFMIPVFFMDAIMSMLSYIIPLAKSKEYALLGAQFMASISGFFLLLILSPVFSMVSEEVISKIKGETYSFSFKQLIKDIIRGIKITLRNLVFEYFVIALISVLIFMLPKIFFLEKIGQLVIVLTTAYFYGFTLMDYALENFRMNHKKSIVFIRKNKGIAIGLGLVYYLVLRLNDTTLFANVFGHVSIYWSSFIEAIVVFIGVIAASIIVSKLLDKLH